MPTLHSHTHCQATRANAKTQAWQRVCLPHRTTNTTDKPTDEKEARLPNTGLAKVSVQCSAVTFVVNQSLVLRIKFSGENRHLLKPANRYVIF